jgi:hypothetical protein
MKCSGQHLFTPVYLKLSEAMPWPVEEKAFHLLTSDGLFLCRNTPFFRSCVPVADYPSELARQRPFLKLRYPRLPRRLLEQVVGFFDLIGVRHASEAAALLAWNRNTGEIEVLVPDQVGLVGLSWNDQPFPMELHYTLPALPSHLVLLGDIHSHVDGPAYSSGLDQSDEVHRPGLHLVVGRIRDEPPQFHCEATADGVRFQVSDLSLVLEGYYRRRVHEVPPEWIRKVTIKPWSRASHSYLGSQPGRSGSKGEVELEANPLEPADRPDQRPPPAAGDSSKPPIA